MSLLNIPEISTLFSQPTFGLVEQAPAAQIDLFAIWKFCALAVAATKAGEQVLNILTYWLDPSYEGWTFEFKALFTAVSTIAIMFQIPYVKLGLDEDIYEFANDGLSQFVIILDIINIFAEGTLLYLLAPQSSTSIVSYVFDAMSAFRSIGYFIIAYDYMQ